MSSKKKPHSGADEVAASPVKQPAPRNPHIYDAKAIHTGTGAGLMVEALMLDGKATFVMRHLGTAGCVPVSLDGAKALRILLDEWIAAQEPWQNGEFRLAT